MEVTDGGAARPARWASGAASGAALGVALVGASPELQPPQPAASAQAARKERTRDTGALCTLRAGGFPPPERAREARGEHGLRRPLLLLLLLPRVRLGVLRRLLAAVLRARARLLARSGRARLFGARLPRTRRRSVALPAHRAGARLLLGL